MKTLKQQHFLRPESTKRLGDLFERVIREYPYYRRIFEQKGLTSADDAVTILDSLPVLDRKGYIELGRDIFSRLKGGQFMTEHTSGTTGPRKIRLVTQRDEDGEEDLCVRFFKQCGLTSSDRVLAMDVDSPDIYLFYSRALLRIGIHDFSYVNFTGPGDEALKPLFTFRPTAILSVPSVLARCRSELARISHRKSKGLLKKVIYIAENISPELRQAFSKEMGLQVFSFYGSTEIGSMAGECQKHDGIHIFNDAVVPTLMDPVDDGECLTGEVAWTTLHFIDQPLIKFVNGDTISIQKERCSCGSDYPLMRKVIRTNDIFAIYGQKFRYEDFAKAIANEVGPVKALRIILTPGVKCDKVVFQVPDHLMKKREAIMKAVRLIEDFDYFLKMGFVVTDIQSLSDQNIIRQRSRSRDRGRHGKANHVIDMRTQKSTKQKEYA